MAGSGAAFSRANSALGKTLSLANTLASNTTGTDGASHVASSDTTGGSLWTSMAGFIAALLRGQVTHSLPTRTQMVANKVPAAVSTILTSGYATAGDGGGATFVRAAGPFSDGASFQSLDGAWWQLSVLVINPAQFGARGDGGTDDTTALQNTIDYAKTTGCAIHLFARTYLHTRSLNWGKANPFDGNNLKVFGSALGQSRFLSALTESFPAHDFTNQNTGTIEHIYFLSTPTSAHTTLMLFAETTGAGMNQFNMSDCLVQDVGNVSKYAVFGWTADQMMIEKCNIFAHGTAALAGAYFSVNNPSAITSKYWSIAPSNADATVFQAYFSAFGCTTGPGLWTQAYNNVNLFSVYSAIIGVGGHSKGIFRFGGSLVGGQPRETSINMLGGRTEDNGVPAASPLVTCIGSIAPGTDSATSVLTVSATAAGAVAVGLLLAGAGIAAGTTVLAQLSATTWQVSQVQTVASTTISSNYLASPAVYIEDYIIESYFQGSLSSLAGTFGGPGTHTNSEVKVAVTYGGFNNAGALIGGKFHFSGGINYGGSFDQINSRGYTLGGRVGTTYAQIYAAYGGSIGGFDDLDIDGTGVQNRLASTTQMVFSDQTANSATHFRHKVSGEANSFNAINYIGGSGLIPIMTCSFNPSYLYSNNNLSGISNPHADIVLYGSFNSAWAAGGEMRFDISQVVSGSTKTTTLIDLTGIPAQNSMATWKLTIKMVGGTGSWLSFTTLEILGAAPVSLGQAINLGSQGFSQGAGTDFSIIGSILNTGSNPVVPGVLYSVG